MVRFWAEVPIIALSIYISLHCSPAFAVNQETLTKEKNGSYKNVTLMIWCIRNTREILDTAVMGYGIE